MKCQKRPFLDSKIAVKQLSFIKHERTQKSSHLIHSFVPYGEVIYVCRICRLEIILASQLARSVQAELIKDKENTKNDKKGKTKEPNPSGRSTCLKISKN